LDDYYRASKAGEQVRQLKKDQKENLRSVQAAKAGATA
jgi:hypothetical protein